MNQHRGSAIAGAAALASLAIGLSGCDVVNTFTDGLKHTHAVEDALQKSTGVKPEVGFNWSNGRLVQVTVAFPRLYDDKPLGELAASVRSAVASEFRQKPDQILLTFALGPGLAPQADKDKRSAL